MIGNDVVDLRFARQESNWKRRGFLEKLFTLAERDVIKSCADPELMVWILWSMKEAAYKIYNRQTGVRAFIPHKLGCAMLSASGVRFSGTVACGDQLYYTETTVADDVIHTIAATSPAKLMTVSEIFPDEVLKDPSGFPYISPDNIPVSVSHHGRARQIVRLG